MNVAKILRPAVLMLLYINFCNSQANMAGMERVPGDTRASRVFTPAALSSRRPTRVRVDEEISFPALGAGWRPRPVSVPLDVNVADESVVTNGLPGEEEEEAPAMLLPLDLETSDMPANTAGMMSNINSIDEFVSMFGLEKPDEKLATNGGGSGVFARFGGSNAVETLNAVCQPENRTVRLDLPRELNVIYFPRCVRLMRCGGCCAGPLLTCQPTQQTPVTLKILRVTSTNGGRSAGEAQGRTRRPRVRGGGSRTRRRREETTSYYEVKETHHTACQCQCRVMKEDCDLNVQDYMEQECLCRCKNTDEEQKCQSKSSTHYWDNKSCSCFCLKEQFCSWGQRFDHASCSCVQVASPSLRSSLGRSARGPIDVAADEEAPVIFD